MSVASTWPGGPTRRAAASDWPPAPAATSSTVLPVVIPAVSSIRLVASPSQSSSVGPQRVPGGGGLLPLGAGGVLVADGIERDGHGAAPRGVVGTFCTCVAPESGLRPPGSRHAVAPDRRRARSDLRAESGAMAFVGRARALSRLLAAVEEAAGGRARLVLVGGEAGIGKTTLIGEFDGPQRAGGRLGYLRRRRAHTGVLALDDGPARPAVLPRRHGRGRPLTRTDTAELARLLPSWPAQAWSRGRPTGSGGRRRRPGCACSTPSPGSWSGSPGTRRSWSCSTTCSGPTSRRWPCCDSSPSPTGRCRWWSSAPTGTTSSAPAPARRWPSWPRTANRCSCTGCRPGGGRSGRRRGRESPAAERWAAEVHRRTAGHPFLARQLAELLADPAQPAGAVPAAVRTSCGPAGGAAVPGLPGAGRGRRGGGQRAAARRARRGVRDRRGHGRVLVEEGVQAGVPGHATPHRRSDAARPRPVPGDDLPPGSTVAAAAGAAPAHRRRARAPPRPRRRRGAGRPGPALRGRGPARGRGASGRAGPARRPTSSAPDWRSARPPRTSPGPAARGRRR